MKAYEYPLNVDTYMLLSKEDREAVAAWLRVHGIKDERTFEIEVLEGRIRAHCYILDKRGWFTSAAEWIEVISVLPPPPDTFQRWLNIAGEEARRG